VPARYIGKPQVEFLSDGRNVKLLADLVFFDPHETQWAVPAGAVVDGASIPKPFWSVVGGPFEGGYRDASIIHDWYCDRRTRTWQATHRVFYDAMLISGVSTTKAKIMYYAVRFGGPRWEERTVMNNVLTRDTIYNFSSKQTDMNSLFKKTIVQIPYPMQELKKNKQLEIFSKNALDIEQRDYSLDEIDIIADNFSVNN